MLYKSIVPIMYSNIQDGFTVSASSTNQQPYKAFDGSSVANSDYYRSSINPSLPEYLTITFPKVFKLGRYTLRLGYYSTNNTNMSTWDLEGRVDGSWVMLHSGMNTQTTRTLTFEITPTDVSGVRIKCKTRHGTGSWGIDELQLFEVIYSENALIHHNGGYKKYVNSKWEVVTTENPTELEYINSNTASEISLIPQSAWNDLAGDIEIHYYTDNPNTESVLFNIETEPFTLQKEWKDKQIQLIEYTDNPNQTDSAVALETEPYSVYDYISDTPDVLIYTESTDDIVVATTTEPYDLYDEFGNEVEVLHYTDDESVTEANLILEANWSPVDELEGDFEIVTWTNEESDTAQRGLEMKATPKPQFIVPIANNLSYGDFRSFVSSLISDNVNISLTRFLLSFDRGITWHSYRYRKWRTVNTTEEINIRKHGMKYDELNAIPSNELISNEFMLGYYLEDRGWTNGDEGVREVVIKSDAYVDDIKISDLLLFVVNTLATISADVLGNKVLGSITDEDLGKVQYRVRLNGEYIYPIGGAYTPLYNTPVDLDVGIDNKKIIIGANNSIQVEFRDGWGHVRSWSTTFVGKPVGLIFSTPTGQYYSNAFGEILRYLDFGTMIAGQTTLDERVVLSNTLPFTVKNIILTTDIDAQGVEIQLSKTANPFEPQEGLIYSDELPTDESVDFYVRLKLNDNAVGNHLFDINANADPA